MLSSTLVAADKETDSLAAHLPNVSQESDGLTGKCECKNRNGYKMWAFDVHAVLSDKKSSCRRLS